MTLSPGTRLGPYTVVAPLGRGGMGEVYRARDAKLQREVALKVLPADVASDPERLSRFDREARVLASLNHPNIGQIYGFEDGGDVRALVLELVEGPTLADRLAGGPMALDDVLPVATQIAAALEVAHAHGIVHRDLKPANVKLRPDGTVKVLDFGLARTRESRGEGTEGSAAQTMSVTWAGTILGTAAYMAPEQARGAAVDHRTDIWAFGCVLFELLTGRPVFSGKTLVDVLAAVLNAEPDWRLLPAGTPFLVDRLLRRCLARDPTERLQAIGDARLALADARESPPGRAEPAARSSRWSRVRMVALAGAAFLIGGLIVAAVLGRARAGESDRPLRRLAVALAGTEAMSQSTSGSVLALSPDGRTIVYVGRRNDVTQLFQRGLDRAESVAIKGTEGAADPFFSPDGEWVGFIASGTIQKIRLASDTAPVVLCKMDAAHGGTWGPDNTIVFGSGHGLQLVSAAGGQPKAITSLGPGELLHGQPRFLPGGRALIFSVDGGTIDTVAAYSFQDGKRRDVIAASSGAYSLTGHLLFLRTDTLWAAPFDPDSLRVTGEPVQLPERVRWSPMGGAIHFAVAADGTFVYVPDEPLPQNEPVWIDGRGQRVPLGLDRGHYSDLALSPDGSRLAFTVDPEFSTGQPGGTWVYDIERRTKLRLTLASDEPSQAPVWSPDGSRVAYSLWQANRFSLFVRRADATTAAERLPGADDLVSPCFWTPDGRGLVYSRLHAPRDLSQVDLVELPLDAGRSARPVVQAPAINVNAALSPDGRFMAYQSSESGRFEVCVRPFPDAASERWVISSEGGADPRWAPSGKALFYRNGRRILKVGVETRPVFRASQAEIVYSGPPTSRDDARLGFFLRNRNYEVTHDGQRLLVLEDVASPDEGGARAAIAIVENWVSQLRGRQPGK